MKKKKVKKEKPQALNPNSSIQVNLNSVIRHWGLNWTEKRLEAAAAGRREVEGSGWGGRKLPLRAASRGGEEEDRASMHRT